MSSAPCELCAPAADTLWADARCRVIAVGGGEGTAFPGFCRVIWTAHVAEMSDLATADAAYLLTVVAAVERLLRHHLQPDKINLASLGNVVPHLHWHVIPRWRDDSHFPRPIWAEALRPAPDRAPPDWAVLAAGLRQALGPGAVPPAPTSR